MTVLRYQYRIYPTSEQKTMLAKTFGCVRTVFNDALALFQAAWRSGLPRPAMGEVARAVTTEAKQRPERAWLAEVSSVPLQQALRDLAAAYSSFFASRAGRRPGLRVGPPRFKRRTARQSARFNRNAFALRANGKLYVAKVGEVKVAWSRELPSEPSSVAVIREATGKYFVSFVVIADDTRLPDLGDDAVLGIDLGLSAFAVMHNGRRIESPKFLRRAEKQLRKAQRTVSRKQPGSANRAKARLRLAKIHARVAARRRDFIEQATTRLVRENQTISLETLDLKGMANRKGRLGKSVHDQALGMFVRVLEAKATRAGRTFVRIDRSFPSTQLCSACGSRTGPRGRAGLKVRDWICTDCGADHDRDVNAAKNILKEGLRVLRLAAGLRKDPAPPAGGAGVVESRNACGGGTKTSRLLAVPAIPETGAEAGTSGNAKPPVG